MSELLTLISDTWLLSLIVFVPSLAAVVLLLMPPQAAEAIKWVSLAGTIVTFALTLWTLGVYYGQAEAGNDLRFRAAAAQETAEQKRPNDLVFRYDWIGGAAQSGARASGFHVEYYMGVDGISLPLVLLTGLVSLLAMIASWNIEKHIRGYCILFLLLETGMMGTFLALDFFLFYVFWEIMLLPMYFLIGIWGAPSRVEADGRVRGGPYAAIKFFIYTLVGSVLLLFAILGFYFHDAPDLVQPTAAAAQPGMQPGGMLGGMAPVGAAGEATEESIALLPQKPARTFDLMKLQRLSMANEADRSRWGLVEERDGGRNVKLVYPLAFQIVMFVLFYVGFAIKVPVFPFHTWLPDAHVEAPTPISMILAGVLLKMGGYGFFRIAYPLCPQAAMLLAPALAGIGVWNIIYGALAAMAQTDFKKLVAYSSISHMGYVILGLAVWTQSSDPQAPYVWSMGMNGAMFQMIAHGLSSAGMFLLVGVIYDRVHHRDLNRFGGLATAMPLYGGLSAGIFFAGLGLPGLCGFIGEVMTVLASWQYNRFLAVLAAAGVILTAGYILWTLQRVFLGVSTASGDHGHGHELPDITFREMLCAVPLLVLAIALGVYPDLVFDFMESTVTGLALDLSKLKPGW